MAYVVEKAGLHYAVIYEGVNPITGKERRRWHRCTDRAEAEALACQLRARRARARRAGSTMTLGDYLLGQWLPSREAALSPATYARYVTSIGTTCSPTSATSSSASSTPTNSPPCTGGCVSPEAEVAARWPPRPSSTSTSCSEPRSPLPSTEELILHNPAIDVRAPDPRKRPSRRRRAASWTAAELATFLDSVESDRYRTLFRLAAATGMRRGELLGLRWSDVHLDTGRLEITQALTAVGYVTSFSRLKTKTSRRCITLDRTTTEHLITWRAEQANAWQRRPDEHARACVHRHRRRAAPPTPRLAGIRPRPPEPRRNTDTTA